MARCCRQLTPAARPSPSPFLCTVMECAPVDAGVDAVALLPLVLSLLAPGCLASLVLPRVGAPVDAGVDAVVGVSRHRCCGMLTHLGAHVDASVDAVVGVAAGVVGAVAWVFRITGVVAC